MAEVNVKRESPSEKETKGRVPARSERGSQPPTVARRGEWPSMFSLSPQEFFSAGPFSLMKGFMDEMERAFSGWDLTGGWGQGFWSPSIEVTERNGKLVVCADLPGVRKEDIKVELTDQALFIQGERRREQEEQREDYYRSERSYGQFRRQIPLPEGVDPDQVQADFSDGVLEITVPLPEHRRRREIRIGQVEQTSEKEAA
jgi:HSP20 family protein